MGKFKKEFKRQLKLAIIAAIGFLIAFGWKDVIYNRVKILVDGFITTTKMFNDVFSALFVTFVGVILILIISKILKD
jgi:hypothetical protein